MNKKLSSLIMTGVLSLSVIMQSFIVNIDAYSSYQRIGGKNRYETSYLVSNRNHSKTIVLASGESYPDALSAVNLSNKFEAETILTNGNISVVDLIKKRGADKVFLVGGVGSISNQLENKLKSAGLNVERIGGTNRYETSKNTIKRAGYTNIGVCSGQNYIDALSASALLKQEDAGLLLVDGTKPYKAPENTVVKYTFGGVKTVVQNGGERIYGLSRYGTAVEIANRVKDPSSLAVVSGLNYPDALSATNLVVSDRAVIMPVEKIAYNDVIKKAKAVEKVFIVGGVNSISNETMNDIIERAKGNSENLGNVENSYIDSGLTSEQNRFLNDLNTVGDGLISRINKVEDIINKIKGINIPNIQKPNIPVGEINKIISSINANDVKSLINSIEKIENLLKSIDTSKINNIKANIEKLKAIKNKVMSIKAKVDAFNQKIDSITQKIADKVVSDMLNSIKENINSKMKDLIDNLNSKLSGTGMDGLN